jgi:hypothetical protein
MNHDRRVRLLTVAIALAVFVLAPGVQPAQAKDTWTEVRSKNFTLIGNAAEKDIRQVANRSNSFGRSLGCCFPMSNLTRQSPPP